MLTPNVGLEPSTLRCSTDWASRACIVCLLCIYLQEKLWLDVEAVIANIHSYKTKHSPSPSAWLVSLNKCFLGDSFGVSCYFQCETLRDTARQFQTCLVTFCFCQNTKAAATKKDSSTLNNRTRHGGGIHLSYTAEVSPVCKLCCCVVNFFSCTSNWLSE